jgi:hypothetical protein
MARRRLAGAEVGGEGGVDAGDDVAGGIVVFSGEEQAASTARRHHREARPTAAVQCSLAARELDGVENQAAVRRVGGAAVFRGVKELEGDVVEAGTTAAGSGADGKEVHHRPAGLPAVDAPR